MAERFRIEDGARIHELRRGEEETPPIVPPRPDDPERTRILRVTKVGVGGGHDLVIGTGRAHLNDFPVMPVRRAAAKPLAVRAIRPHLCWLIRMKKLLSLALATALSAGALSAQTTDASADPVIMTAGELTIRQSEFEAAMRSLPPQYQEYALGPGKRQFAQDFLSMRLLAHTAKKEGLDREPAIVAQLDMMLNNLLASTMLQRLEDSVQLSDADLMKIYEEQKATFETAKARHILIAFAGSPAAQPGKPELTEEQAKEKAEALRARLVAGESFEEIAKAESDDTGSGARGGDLGEFGRGQMVGEFEQAAFTTEIGQVSAVFRTQFGFHIVRVDERGAQAFEQVKEQLAGAERRKQVQTEVERVRTSANPTFDAAYFGN